jgi:acyl dehydratase
MAIDWNSIHEDDELPVLQKTPGVTQLVKYAAGSGDFNPLHHDFNFPQSKMLGSIIVHGRFKYAALGELISNWLGHNGRIKSISCQYRGMDMPDQEIVCGGRVANKYEKDGQKFVDLEVWTANAEGKKTTPGKATVLINK